MVHPVLAAVASSSDILPSSAISNTGTAMDWGAVGYPDSIWVSFGDAADFAGGGNVEVFSTSSPYTVVSAFLISSDGISSVGLFCGESMDDPVPLYPYKYGGSSQFGSTPLITYRGDFHCSQSLYYMSNGGGSAVDGGIQIVPYDTRAHASTTPAIEPVTDFFLFLILGTVLTSFILDRVIGVKVRENVYNTYLGNNSPEGKKIYHD